MVVRLFFCNFASSLIKIPIYYNYETNALRYLFTTTMKRTPNILTVLTVMLLMASCGTKQEVKQESETAAEAVEKMTAGWCLGNDMDAFDTDIKPGAPLEEYETCWGQQPANELLFKKLAEKGFDAIRVPVTWWQHMDAEGQVDAAWMGRVEQIVNWVMTRELP